MAVYGMGTGGMGRAPRAAPETTQQGRKILHEGGREFGAEAPKDFPRGAGVFPPRTAPQGEAESAGVRRRAERRPPPRPRADPEVLEEERGVS